MDRMDDDDDDDMDVHEEEELFTYIAMITWSCMAINPGPMAWLSLGSVDNDESLALGDEVDEELFSLFFIVEFQKFFISLSVRPGKRAAIWDHLLFDTSFKKTDQIKPVMCFQDCMALRMKIQ